MNSGKKLVLVYWVLFLKNDEKLVTKPFAVSTGGFELLCLVLMTAIGCLKNYRKKTKSNEISSKNKYL